MQRSGAALYSLVLLTAVLVSTIGLAALQLARARGRELNSANDMSQARTIAAAALQMAICRIASDDQWHNQLSGQWLVRDQAYQQGLVSISVFDPLDGQISGTDSSLLVVGSGQQGTAVQNLSMRLNREPHPQSCLRAGLAAGGGINLQQSILRGTAPLATSGSVQATSSTIYTDVIASGSLIGSGVMGRLTTGAPARRLPDPTNTLNYYLLNGTTVSLSSLPRWQQTQIVRNSSFEADTSSWYALTDCTLSRSQMRAVSGTSSLRVSGRASRDDTVAQDVTLSALKNGNLLHLAIPFFPTANGTASVRLTLQSTGDGTQILNLPDFVCAKNGQGVYSWITLEGDLRLNWTGTLTKATLSIETSFNQEFYIDAVSAVDATYPHDMPVLDRQLLSPTNNPLGSTNAQGIYVINCGYQDIMIGRSRIVGTIVLIQPGAGSCIRDCVNMEPAAIDLPCLLIDGSLRIAMDGTGFSEAAIGLNLNPSSSPYPYSGGFSNATLADNYPAILTGLIYATGSLTIEGTAQFRGVIVANDVIQLSTADVTLAYDDRYLLQPPLGFSRKLTLLRPKLGTIQRTVNTP